MLLIHSVLSLDGPPYATNALSYRGQSIWVSMSSVD